MSDPNFYRLVEQSVIEAFRSDVEQLRSAHASQQFRLENAERQLREYEAQLHKHERYDYRISVIVITPEAASAAADEVIYVSSNTEAAAKEKEIFARRNELKRKVMICNQTTLKSIPF